MCSRFIILNINSELLNSTILKGVCFMSVYDFQVEGLTVEEIESKLTGVLCGRRPTSCADQLAKAVRAAYEAQAS